MEKPEITNCDECGSLYYQKVSRMNALCPECSHLLYGYEACIHEFKGSRCTKCFWDGSRSEYIQKIVAKLNSKGDR